MNMKKTTLSIILAALTLISSSVLLTSCGEEQTSTSPTEAVTESATKSTAKSSLVAAEKSTESTTAKSTEKTTEKSNAKDDKENKDDKSSESKTSSADNKNNTDGGNDTVTAVTTNSNGGSNNNANTNNNGANKSSNSNNNNTVKNNNTSNNNNNNNTTKNNQSGGNTSNKTWHEAVHKTVNHPAETKPVWVVDQKAYSYEEPVYEEHWRTICNTCGADITNCLVTHGKSHTLNGQNFSYHSEPQQIQVGTKTVKVPEQGHYETEVVKEACTEKVLVKEAGYY